MLVCEKKHGGLSSDFLHEIFLVFRLAEAPVVIDSSESPIAFDRDIYVKRGDKNNNQHCVLFLFLAGHVEVEIGKENLVFESGPFNYFGAESLDCKLSLLPSTFFLFLFFFGHSLIQKYQ